MDRCWGQRKVTDVSKLKGNKEEWRKQEGDDFVVELDSGDFVVLQIGCLTSLWVESVLQVWCWGWGPGSEHAG